MSQIHRETGYAISHHPCVLQLLGQSSYKNKRTKIREKKEKYKN